MASADSKPSTEETKSEVKSETTEDKPSEKPTENGTEKVENGSDEATKPENGSDAAVKEEKTEANGDGKKKLLKVRFTGAAKRRYRLLIERGYDREEAAQLAKEPIKTSDLLKAPGKNRPLKRGRTEGLGGPPNKLAKQMVRMAVSTENFPATTFTGEQANKVKSAILKQMLSQKDSAQKPHFQDCNFTNGYLLVHCSDSATVKWLQHTVPKLEPYKGCSLKVTNERALSRMEVLVGVFNDSRQDTSKDILGFIECQNDGLSTSKWTIVSRRDIPKKQSVELTFSVDPASSKVLQKEKYELNYKFNKVSIRKKATEGRADKAGVRSRTNDFQRTRPQQQRSSSFVPIWDNNVPRGGANYARPRSPSRGFGNRNGNRFGGSKTNRFSGGGSSNRFNSGGNSNRFSGGSNSGRLSGGGNSNRFSGGSNSSGRLSGGNAFTSGTGSRGLPNLVDTLCNELLRSVGGSGQNRGNNYQQGGRNFGGRSGFF